jgi:hypothetical protein
VSYDEAPDVGDQAITGLTRRLAPVVRGARPFSSLLERDRLELPMLLEGERK